MTYAELTTKHKKLSSEVTEKKDELMNLTFSEIDKHSSLVNDIGELSIEIGRVRQQIDTVKTK